MSRYRTPSKRSAYYIPKEDYLTAIHWCRRYPNWIKELKVEPDTSKAITYDKLHVQTSGDFDPTTEIAMHRAEISGKVKLLEEVVKEAAPDIYEWLLKGLTQGIPEYKLRQDGMPCGHNKYYRSRQHALYLISKRI